MEVPCLNNDKDFKVADSGFVLTQTCVYEAYQTLPLCEGVGAAKLVIGSCTDP